MPDIRDFFGGGGRASQTTTTAASSQEKKPASKRNSGKRKVIEDSDDDEPTPATKTPDKKRAAPPASSKRLKESPKGEETTTSDYFQTTSKARPSRSTPTKKKASAVREGSTSEVQISPPKNRKVTTPRSNRVQKSPSPRPSGGRTSARRKKPISYKEHKENDGDAFVDDDDDSGDDIFVAEHKKPGRGKGDDYLEDDEDDDDDDDLEADEEEDELEVSQPRPSTSRRTRTTPLKAKQVKALPKDKDVTMKEEADVDSVHPGSKEKVISKQHVNGTRAATSASKKGKRSIAEEEEENDLEFAPAKPPSKAAKIHSPVKKPTPKKAKPASKKEETEDSNEIKAIIGSIPTVRPPSPPPKTEGATKFNYQAHAARTAPPAAAGTKEIPIGQENCLAGQTFVFTGLLDSLGREEGIELVKRYGGHVTTAPSSKTSFVVLGHDAGPKKLETIRKLNLKTTNEDGLFELIRRLPANGGDSKAAVKNEEKKQKEELKFKQMAAEMETEERRLKGAGGAGGGNTGKGGSAASVDSRLWTVKYAPSSMTQICGNKGQVEKLQRWLREWPNNLKINFKKAGKDGSFNFRAVIIHGPPGIGKTTAAHLAAKMEGYDILESNASDTRSKKLVDTGLKGILDNTSLLGYFAGDQKKVDAGKKKLVLIMDEVDGMSAGDRGGVGALAQVCRKTHIPMILICNDRRLPKMRPFDHVTYELPFRRPTANDIRSRIASICFREGLKLPPQVIDALIEGSHADIRQIINMISQAKLDQEALSFDQGKAMTKAWEKHIILKPWDIAHKLLGTGMFGTTSNKTLNDKIELYFNDHEFSYLMIQENYLKTRPQLAASYTGREQKLKTLEVFDKAAESISDGDLVDRMIHGSQQQWSLMPTHAVLSTVRPASFIYGGMTGQASFTSWLGQNSKQGKLVRFVKEIQGHMRLRASGDRHEIRQQYLPVLWQRLVNRLQRDGKEAVEDVIDLMDSYFLTREDFDAIMELGLGPMDMERVKIESQTKATFTRLYNQQSHPLPFMKASNVIAPKKGTKEKPDLEEAIDESDDGEDVAAVKADEDDEDDLDLSKDKYVKQPKKKAAPKKSAAAKKAAPAKKTKGKPKKKAESEDEAEESESEEEPSEEDVKPAKGKGKATAKGRGKK